MRITLDTEFYEDGRTIELISIGMVREDGEEYYAEVVGADELCAQSDWLMENVHPYLTGPRKAKSQIAMEVVAFADLEPEFWAWYGSYDWVVLCQLYGAMIDLPPTWPMFIRDFRQTADLMGLLLKHSEEDGPEHHALSDARWLMRVMNFYEEEKKRPIVEKIALGTATTKEIENALRP